MGSSIEVRGRNDAGEWLRFQLLEALGVGREEERSMEKGNENYY